MKKYKIAIYGGDGIGVEVADEAVKVMEAAEKVFGFKIEKTDLDWGHRHWEKTGKVVPDGFMKVLADFDAIYLGALGDPEFVPDHITLVPLIEMRQGFDQYVCLRPARLLPNVKTPLANRNFGDIDMVVVRENSEGEYVSMGGRTKIGQPGEVAVQTGYHTRKGVERILRYGFELARKRRKVMTMATKSNALKYAMVMWDEILVEVAKDYPDVKSDKYHVDNLCQQIVKNPTNYDVIVGSNLFGDILSDLTGAVSGSLGLAPSANINPERKHPSLFEPVHGSAPKHAGKHICNPLAAIRSAAMMLDFIGQEEAGKAIEDAVVENLKDGKVRTYDLGGTAKTNEVGDDVAKRVLAKK